MLSGHEERRLRQGVQVDRLVGDALGQQILDHDDADHIVEVVARHRIARVAVRQHDLAHLLVAVIDVKPDHIGARRHDGADRAVAEAEDLAEDLLFDRLEDARLRPLLDQDAHLFFGDGRLVVGLDAQQAQQAELDLSSTQTAGRVIAESPRMGVATQVAMRSALLRAMRLGTSSPTTSDR